MVCKSHVKTMLIRCVNVVLGEKKVNYEIEVGITSL